MPLQRHDTSIRAGYRDESYRSCNRASTPPDEPPDTAIAQVTAGVILPRGRTRITPQEPPPLISAASRRDYCRSSYSVSLTVELREVVGIQTLSAYRGHVRGNHVWVVVTTVNRKIALSFRTSELPQWIDALRQRLASRGNTGINYGSEGSRVDSDA